MALAQIASITLAALVAASAIEMGLQPAQQSDVSFHRQCDMMCESVSSWYDTLESARRACGADGKCIAVVDHSGTGGKHGVCLKGASFIQGSKERNTLAAVCVEYKGEAAQASLLQLDATAAVDAGSDVSARFERECDMMCDGNAATFHSLDAARQACVASSSCAAIVDHSANKGFFGLCGHENAVSRGSDRHEVFTRVCVERKRGM
jgi:hypothetical protein